MVEFKHPYKTKQYKNPFKKDGTSFCKESYEVSRLGMLEFDDICTDIAKETYRAVKLYGPINSMHEAYAVMLEEMDEFWDEVKKKHDQRDSENMRKELIQIAAMCVRTIHDFKLGWSVTA